MDEIGQMPLDFAEAYDEELKPDPTEPNEGLAPAGEEIPETIEGSSDSIEEEIRANLRKIDYTSSQYTVEDIVRKYLHALTEDEQGLTELYVPSYQREFVWELWRQSRFIESILIGLPIPQILLAQQVAPSDEDQGALEIVDGSQRVRTLWAFVYGKLRLTGLDRLKRLNGKTIDDLLPSRRRKFLRTNIRAIELTELSVDDVTLDLFLRINQGSMDLKAAEVRRGAFRGKLYDEIRALAGDPLTMEMLPVQGTKADRREREELILRFIAYTFDMDNFIKPVAPFLELFVREHKDEFRDEWRRAYIESLTFVKANFSNGFRKTPSAKSVPRVRFEAIAIGSALALEQRPNLVPSTLAWLDSEDFKRLTSADGSNSAPRLKARLFYVRDRLLGVEQ